MKKIYFTLFILAFTLTCCIKEEIFILPIQKAKNIGSISQFSDGIYFQEVFDIEEYKGNYYFLDGAINRIFCTDKELNYKYSFVSNGGADFEATGLGSMAIFQDTLYVSDISASKLMMFDIQGKFIQSYRTELWGIGDFFVNEKEIIVFNDEIMYRSNPLMRFDKHSKVRNYFGSEAKDIYKNPDRHILSLNNNKLISIYAENRPIIEIYSNDGKILIRKDLGHLHIFKSVLEYYEEKVKNNPLVDLVLIPDAYYSDGHLYLLVTNMDKERKWYSNNIIDCEINEDDNVITPIRIIQLKDGWHESIYVNTHSKELLTGNDTEGLIEKYILP